MTTDLEALQSRIELLEKALEPFARDAEWWAAFHDYQKITHREHGLEVGDLRRAKAALSGSKPA